MTDFQFTHLSQDINVTDIVTIHYFEYSSAFYFPGERHHFWEFLYVDKGQVLVKAGEKEHTLLKGDLIFHKPDEFHNVRADGIVSPNLVVVSFQCESPAMAYFHNRIVKTGEKERNLLAQLIKEALQTFSSRLDDPFSTSLCCVTDAPLGSLQLIKLYLEQLLITLLRKGQEKTLPVKAPMELSSPPDALQKTVTQKKEQALYEQLVQYLEDHIGEQLTTDQICQDLLVSSSQVQKLFNRKKGCGIIRHFSQMKIERAKEYIRSQQLNFSQISESLGYTSLQYFSRQFKKLTGMTPSQYAYSVKALSDDQVTRQTLSSHD